MHEKLEKGRLPNCARRRIDEPARDGAFDGRMRFRSAHAKRCGQLWKGTLAIDRAGELEGDDDILRFQHGYILFANRESRKRRFVLFRKLGSAPVRGPATLETIHT